MLFVQGGVHENILEDIQRVWSRYPKWATDLHAADQQRYLEAWRRIWQIWGRKHSLIEIALQLYCKVANCQRIYIRVSIWPVSGKHDSNNMQLHKIMQEQADQIRLHIWALGLWFPPGWTAKHYPDWSKHKPLPGGEQPFAQEATAEDDRWSAERRQWPDFQQRSTAWKHPFRLRADSE